MKKLFTPVLLLLFFGLPTQAQDVISVTNFSQGGDYSDVFTTNSFKCINIGKDGIIWAGTQRGGLYRYNSRSTSTFEAWVKSEKLTDVTINDIKVDKNGGIWIAQSGQLATGGGLASNVAGGINYFPSTIDYGMQFFSQAGTDNDGFLYTRNVRSLFISPSASNQVWAIQGESRSSGNQIRGGLNIGQNGNQSFLRIAKPFSGWDWGWQSNPTGEVIGGSFHEIWAGVRKNNQRTQIIRYGPNGQYLPDAIIDDTNVPQLQKGFTPTVIFFDRAGNKWIGMKEGGLVIQKKGSKKEWVAIRDTEIKAGGFNINLNAVAEDINGSIYFGTTAGLMVYESPEWNPDQDPAKPGSYKFYTTENGLSNNNITGAAYNEERGSMLLTSDAGVTFLGVRPKYIKGGVFDVFTNFRDPNATEDLRRIPEQTATVKLYLGDDLKETTNAGADGFYELKKAEDGKSYSVEIEYTNKEGRKMKYIYNTVANHSYIRPTLFPDSLIREINGFKKEMANRCFEFKPFSLPLPIKTCYEGFNMIGYDEPGQEFFKTTGISKDHYKKVENLGIYLANMKAVYELGGNAQELTAEMFDNIWSLIGLIGGSNDLGKVAVEKIPTASEKLKKAQIKIRVGVLKGLREGLLSVLKANSSILGKLNKPDLKKSYDDAVSIFSDASETIISVADEMATGDGFAAGAKGAFISQLTKFCSVQFGAVFYQEMYAQSIHKTLVQDAVSGSLGAKSNLSYPVVFEQLIDPNGKSLVKFGVDTVKSTKATVEKVKKLSDVIGVGGEIADAGAVLVLIPGGQVAAAILQVVAKAAKIVQTTLVAGAIAVDAVGLYEVVDMSKTTLDKSGINGKKAGGSIKREPATTFQDEPVNLLASKNNLKNKISAFQAVAGAPVFDINNFTNSLNDYLIADSAFKSETRNTFNELLASTDSASVYIEGFTDRVKILLDSFVSRQLSFDNAFYLQQLVLLIDSPNKGDYFPALNSTANEMKVVNDSAYNNLVRLIHEINDNNIGAPAYVDQSGYSIVHDHTPGSAGSFTYKFKNYGKEEMRNVSFKIDEPSEGFTITTAKLINVGTIPAGAEIQIAYNFLSPAATDSFTIGKFAIKVNADNGKYRNTFGTLYILNKTALPVSLSHFDIKCAGTQTQLIWETLTESNSSHFEIERSAKGNNWLTIGSIEAAGNSNIVKEYKFVDSPTENALYRLKQLDKDGKFTYSLVEKSKCIVEKNSLTVYPIPTNNILNLITTVAKNSAVEIRIFDVAGREVKRSNSMLRAGYNTIRVNTNGLASGQYILRMEGSEISRTTKITIGK